jgi:DNA-binding NarL/FixJ family response regulator
LVVAPPGLLRDCLETCLRTLPQIEEVRVVDQVPSALEMAAEIPPSLVLVDVYRFGKGVRTVLNQLKAQGIPSPCLVLVEDRQQQQEAEEADVVLFKGVPAAQLFATIEGLLAESRKKGALAGEKKVKKHA